MGGLYQTHNKYEALRQGALSSKWSYSMTLNSDMIFRQYPVFDLLGLFKLYLIWMDENIKCYNPHKIIPGYPLDAIIHAVNSKTDTCVF